VIDLGVCLGVKALFQPLPPCFDPDLIISPHGVSSRQFNFEPLETLSTYHTIEPVKGIIWIIIDTEGRIQPAGSYTDIMISYWWSEWYTSKQGRSRVQCEKTT
jgi:hypothetical protein